MKSHLACQYLPQQLLYVKSLDTRYENNINFMNFKFGGLVIMNSPNLVYRQILLLCSLIE